MLKKKKIIIEILLILLLLPLSSYSLPKCEGTNPMKWDNCKGTLSLKTFKYEGEWKNGNYDGYGIFTADGGVRYEGQFKNGRFHGEGKIIRRDGSMYVGEYVNGLEHGSGVQHFKGEKIMGIWEKGKLIRRVYE